MQISYTYHEFLSGEAAGIARNNKAAYPDRRVTRT